MSVLEERRRTIRTHSHNQMPAYRDQRTGPANCVVPPFACLSLSPSLLSRHPYQPQHLVTQPPFSSLRLYERLIYPYVFSSSKTRKCPPPRLHSAGLLLPRYQPHCLPVRSRNHGLPEFQAGACEHVRIRLCHPFGDRATTITAQYLYPNGGCLPKMNEYR
jgi:hypothetical protein